MSERYKTIVADPPWHYGTTAPYEGATMGPGRVAKTRPTVSYETLKTEDICGLPVARFAAEDSYLWLWTTDKHLLGGDAVQVVEAWGFRPIQTVVWVKTKPLLGYYLRRQHEQCLFCVRGSPGQPEDRGIPTVFEDSWQRHSQKPPAFYALVERATPGPYLELFARKAQGNLFTDWTFWGNEVGDPLDIGFSPEQWKGAA